MDWSHQRLGQNSNQKKIMDILISSRVKISAIIITIISVITIIKITKKIKLKIFHYKIKEIILFS